MPTFPQLAANQRNAQHSTGPRTEEGKKRSRFNALKHGLRTKTLVLTPQEDPVEYQKRVDDWMDDLRPTSPSEELLARDVADLSWKKDRAERCEGALVHQQVVEAMEEARRLILEQADAPFHALIPRDEPTSPVPGLVLRAQVESTARGCRSLIGVWEGLLETVRIGKPWSSIQEMRAARLLGAGPGIVADPDAVALITANRVVRRPGSDFGADHWWEDAGGIRCDRGAVVAAVEARPRTAADALAWMAAVAETEIGRLETVLRDRPETPGPVDEIPEEVRLAADAATYRGGAELDAVRRCLDSITRRMQQGIDRYLRYRKESARLRTEEEAELEMELEAGSATARVQALPPASSSAAPAAPTEEEAGGSDQSDPGSVLIKSKPFVNPWNQAKPGSAAGSPPATNEPNSSRSARRRREKLARAAARRARRKPPGR